MMTLSASLPRKTYAHIPEILEIPNLIQLQVDSYNWFWKEGLRELLNEITPIKDPTGNRLELHFLEHSLGSPKHSEVECLDRDATYAAPLKVKVQLVRKDTGEIKEQDIFMGDFPLMTPQGTFIINGAERVVVSQLVRSPGVYFTIEKDVSTDRDLCYAKLIPSRGAWLEFETSNKDVLTVKVDQKRKIPVTTLLRALGYGIDEEILALFQDVDTNPDRLYIKVTLSKEQLHPAPSRTEELKKLWEKERPGEPFSLEGAKGMAAALLDIYRRLRPGDPPTLDNAQALIKALFFNSRRYDLGRVGRYKLNKRLGYDGAHQERILSRSDLVDIVRHIIRVNNGKASADDIDHLGNRRIRAVGELIQNQFRIGLLRLERVVRERMSIVDVDTVTPSALVNIRPVVAVIKEFFGGSQLSQFMDQTNPLAELTHKRRLSALGPGGLSRERAGFDVRDVHHSHYGRICPIETPEGPNIGLIGSLATYARVNEYGFIETPYRKVVNRLPHNSPQLVGQTLGEDLPTKDGKGLVGQKGDEITSALAKKLARLPAQDIPVRPFVTPEIVYLDADREENYIIAQANVRLDEQSQFTDERVEVRRGSHFTQEDTGAVEFMDVSPKQIVSVATALIPFLEHDDANRALMGSNMQRQAVPLLRPEAPLVGTGVEARAAQDSGQVLLSDVDGAVIAVSSGSIVVRDSKGQHHAHRLRKFVRSNQGTCINQRPLVVEGQRVKKRQPLADSSSTEGGELALGQNVLCAFMSWEGYNFEDAIVISESLVRADKFTSIHIEKHEVEARDTKLGPEEMTRDIPNVGEESLRDLDEVGIIRVGAEVGPGDILVGKITPKGETELTAEEKLLRAIFGEKAREVKDTSLRVPHGESGKVIDVRTFSRDAGDELPPGVNTMIRVCIAQQRKISVGDKMAGRHGNKGVIARILPMEDMPFLPDGRPVEIILNPIGVPSRMNVGQIYEAHLGWATHILGFSASSPVFDGADDLAIEDSLVKAWLGGRSGAASFQHTREGEKAQVDWAKLEAFITARGFDPQVVLAENSQGQARELCLRVWLEDQGVEVQGLSRDEVERKSREHFQATGATPPTFGKATLYDGRTGEPFSQPVTVGSIYMMKLIHLVEDKIHARSTGPYSLITQQPLGGKAQFGGQRFGEMEVWALEAYGAAYNLQELLTVKSDDVVGRGKTYEAIVKGEDIQEPGVPESFKVLVTELQSLGLLVEVLNEEEEQVSLLEDASGDAPVLREINLEGFERGDDA
ncbi:MAG: DNA-directed RNA polymerase subunit beta [Chloroflexi bacterium]|nr:DNA-directed RNA polymerase subunit beta [Chloroflexota bacterium]